MKSFSYKIIKDLVHDSSIHIVLNQNVFAVAVGNACPLLIAKCRYNHNQVMGWTYRSLFLQVAVVEITRKKNYQYDFLKIPFTLPNLVIERICCLEK